MSTTDSRAKLNRTLCLVASKKKMTANDEQHRLPKVFLPFDQQHNETQPNVELI